MSCQRIAKKQLDPGDYAIVLEHCKQGWSFGSVCKKIGVSQDVFYRIVRNDLLIKDIIRLYCPKYMRRKAEWNK